MNELLFGLLMIFVYFCILALIAITIRKTLHIPDEVFRKILHFILLFSLIVFLQAFETWWLSCIACVVFVVIVFPILMFFEKFKTFSKVVTERNKGELKISLIVVFLMFAIVIAIGWGWLKDKYIVCASIYSWGLGDAAAALIGTKFGKQKIYKKKSLEGTLAMLITSFCLVLGILIARGSLSWYSLIIIPLVVSLSVTAVELFTPNGFDTITCPLTSLIVLTSMLLLFGGLTI